MTTFCIRNLFLTLGATFALVLAGLWSWRQVPVDAIPDLSDNQVIVWAEWPGKSPLDMDLQVTSRLALELQGLPGVRTVRGMSLYGASYVYVIFEDRRDLYDSRTRVLERLAQLEGVLPEGVVARLGPDATAMGQIYAFTLQGTTDVEHRRWMIDQVVAPVLRAAPGVAEVAPTGGVVREYQIDVDPERLVQQGITLEMLMAAVSRAGRDVGAMSVEQSGVETMIRGVGFIRSVQEVENIVVRGDATRGAGLRLGEIAQVQLGGQFRQGLLADAHREHVGAIVAMRVGEDPKAVIDAVKHALAALEPALAREGLSAVAFYDRSELIRETTATLADTLVHEVVVTALVVLVFLLHARASMVVSVVLPLGMLFTFLVMHALGVGANIMSLAGIAIAVGVMVDFGIVMTENVTQHLVDLQQRCREQGRAMPTSPFHHEIVEAVVNATREVTRPLLTSAGTTIIGFLPIFVLTDQAGRLFTPLAVTKTIAITGAVLFGVLLVPALCRLLLPPWQVRKPLLLAFAGAAAGVAFGWFVQDGWKLSMEHDRWSVHVPGWLFAPGFALLVALAVWRIGRERLVEYEANPTSRAIHVAYDWAYVRILRHKVAFTVVVSVLALGGYLVGAGWPLLSWPVRTLVAAVGGDFSRTVVDQAMTRWFPGVGSSFLPPLDEGSLLFMPSLPAAAGLGETQRVMLTQNSLIETIPEVASVMGKLGRAETALDPAPLGMIETVVLLRPYSEWPVHDIPLADGGTQRRPRTLAEVRAALAAISDIPGVAPSWLQPIETRVVMLSTGIRSLVALQILGDDSAALERFAEAAEKIVQTTPGAVDVQMQREGGKPYAEVRLDPARLARFGITAEDAMRAVESGLGGMAVTWSVEGALRYPVRIRVQRERRDDPDELLDLRVPVGDASVPLSRLLAVPTIHTLALDPAVFDVDALLARLPLDAQRNLTPLGTHEAELTVAAGDVLPVALQHELEEGRVRVIAERPSEYGLTYTIGPMAIRSEGGKRTQYVMLNVRDRGEVEVVRDADARLRAALADGRLELPAGATYRWVGRYEQKIKTDETMRWVVAVSLAVMIVLIFVGTRSWLVTGIILLCNVPVNTGGGFLAVWFFGAEMTTAVIVGFLVLLGVMFNDSILLGTYIHEQFKSPPRDLDDVKARVLRAALRRRRPAIMTTATTLLSLAPVLWSTGRGSELMQPMILPVVGGMAFDLVSLFAVPVFYVWHWERKLRRSAVRGTAAEPPPGLDHERKSIDPA
jgi:Cu(I)/Ag(I) efflux system membrane protein CusA/SilA